MIEEPNPGAWRWRDLREIGLGLEFWPLSWSLCGYVDADQYGGRAELHVGPVGVVLEFNCGGLEGIRRVSARNLLVKRIAGE